MTDIDMALFKTGKRYDVLNAYDRIDVVNGKPRKTIWTQREPAPMENYLYHQQFGSTSDSWVNHLPTT